LEKEKSLAKFDEGLAVPVELDALGHDREGERAGEGDERLDQRHLLRRRSRPVNRSRPMTSTEA